jgi:hypothetical protein
MFNPLIKWQKVWFFLRNDVDTLLPVATCSHPVLPLKWGYGLAQGHIRRLQPLHDVIQRLLRGGLIGTNLLWTFVSRRIQPLHRWEMTMWI